MTTFKWQFAAKFRKGSFGWKSDKPIQRIKEALTEIKQVAKKEPVLAAEGAVLFLEKISPALEAVDSSSGTISNAVNRAIETLVAIMAKVEVEESVRQHWLERLWIAVQNDKMPYIELLTDYWGDLCVTPEIATHWGKKLQPFVENSWLPSEKHNYFCGTDACFSALYQARKYEDLLSLLDKVPFSWWRWRQWGVKALVALDKKTEAIEYAKNTTGADKPNISIAIACEEILLSLGNYEQAYNQYALEANQGTTNLTTFRNIAKKYPDKKSAEILRDLINSQPGSEGKWFAAAKEAGLFDLAVELVKQSPTDPRTLIQAAFDYAEQHCDFAWSCGLAAIYWMSSGYGYKITGADVQDAYKALTLIASNKGLTETELKKSVADTVANTSDSNFILKVLML